MTEAKFEQCIRQMNQGDKEGLREIYEEYVSYIYGIVMQMIGNRENAEDITSDFFIRLWEKSELYRPGGGHRGWMATIARNMTVDFIRRYRREELTAQFAGTEDEPDREGGEVQQAVLEISTVGGNFRTSEVEEKVISRTVIREALASLSEKEREVVHLKIIGDMTFKEISEVLKVPMGTVSWRYREAVNKLRRCGYDQGL
ncbi:MAG: RNA polymerase sigma factor [Lachnospiraceae bacterium]|nr:RNA polymerase sigma factor [Lachnospiraceae bacterium]